AAEERAVSTEMSPRDMRKTPWISPEMLPAARVGALVPTPGVLVELASCGDRAEGPQSHQIVDRHGEGKHPADTVAAAMPRLAKQTDRLEPPEHFLDPLADSLAHAVARVASRPRVEGGDLLLRHVRGHVERAEARDEVPIVVVLVGAERRAAAPGNRLRHGPRRLPFGPPRGASEASVHHEPVPILDEHVPEVAELGLVPSRLLE